MINLLDAGLTIELTNVPAILETQERQAAMQEWNAVICVHEHGYKRARDVFGDFGEVRRTEFFNVLILRAEDLNAMLEALSERSRRAPESLSFLSRLIPVDHAFIFNSAEEFEKKARESILGWRDKLAGKRFYVRIHRRGFKGRISSPDEERMLDTLLLQELEKISVPGRIAFEDPDAIIAVETIGTWAGIALLTREQREQYPFVRIN